MRQDFLGFSYGFRPGRSQHDALDALAVGITRKKVNFVLDADIRDFFTGLDQSWLVKFLEHRIADKRVLRLIQKWLGRRGHRGRGMVKDGGGDGARGVGFAAALKRLPALRVRPVGRPVAAAPRARGRDPRAVRRRLRGGL